MAPRTPPSSRHPFTPLAIGIGVSRGFAAGKPLLLAPRKPVDLSRPFETVEAECGRLQAAREAVIRSLDELIRKAGREVGAEEALLFEAHRLMMEDEELLGPIRIAIAGEKCIPEAAIRKTFGIQAGIFASSDSDYLRERALDLRDLEAQLLEFLQPGTSETLRISDTGILVADELTPSQTMLLDRSRVLGILTRNGGPTSHSAILARTLGIPAVSGLGTGIPPLSGVPEIAIDGEEGTLFAVDTPEIRVYFEEKSRAHHEQLRQLESYRGRPSLTHDLHPIRLYANIGGIEDAEAALEGDAEGVGLFRTEFLFLRSKTVPGFEEQRKAYRKVLSLFPGKEVVIRLLDIGGDKPAPALNLPKEENPFLGLRGLRWCLENAEIFRTQLRALLAANEWGNLSILIPMVSSAEEASRVRNLLEECEEELIRSGEYHDQPWRLGAMIEVPSIAFELDALRESVSFVSVGTNDLLQYLLAVDRGNAALKDLYHPYHPGFLRLMRQVAEEAEKNGLEAGICGEAGGQEDLLPLWIAMGYTKLSMSASEILSRRRRLSRLSRPECESLLREILTLRNPGRVRAFLSSGL